MDLYSFSLWAFRCRDSTLMFLHRMLVNEIDKGQFTAKYQDSVSKNVIKTCGYTEGTKVRTPDTQKV